jgi:hypothetical protein
MQDPDFETDDNPGGQQGSPGYPFEIFPRIEPFLVFIFAIFTCKAYVIYWLLTRTRLLNELCPERPVPFQVVVPSIVAFGLYMYMLLSMPVQEGIGVIELMNSEEFLPVAYANLFLDLSLFIWGLYFCFGLNHYTGASSGTALYSSPGFMLLANVLLVNPVYLQYKINQISKSREPGIM